MRRLLLVVVVSFVALITATTASAAPGPATYEVTITNLTTGQALTPPVVATHRKPFHVFEVGDRASFEVKEIAENGNNGPLLATLAGEQQVFDMAEGSTGPLVPAADPGGSGFGDSVTLSITSAKGAKYLSFASMLICTNDGFTGIDGVRLPKKVGDTVTLSTAGYDAGTEINTEDFANIVPPCQGLIGISSGDPGTGSSDPALAEGVIIRHHPGIMGGNDLVPGVHGWVDPVVEVVIERVG